MLSPTSRLEISRQSIPALTNETVSLGESRPLHELAAEAWQLDYDLYEPGHVRFPFSNDECTAPYFEQLQIRINTNDYRTAKNRVAILIGESSLAANLRYIPEETIILLDQSPDMGSYMGDYVEGLREQDNIQKWTDSVLGDCPDKHYTGMFFQLDEWANNGYDHALEDETAFQIAKKAAQQKAIIPWLGDITDPDEMDILGDTLRDYDATVTFMNLTNVIPYVGGQRSARYCARQLARLPISRHAPILATNLRVRKPRNHNEAYSLLNGSRVAEATGPFFGLQNLMDACSESSGNSVTTRQYPEVIVTPTQSQQRLDWAEDETPNPLGHHATSLAKV